MNTPTDKNTAPAEAGIWLVLLADMTIFAMYFAVFAWDRSLQPQQFMAGQATLDTRLGALNTLLLLTSSYFMATAVHAARTANSARYSRYLMLTIGCGCAFLVVKAVEYGAKFSAGYDVATNLFYRDYFAFTGLHMLHVIIGLCLLAYAWLLGKNSTDIHQHRGFIENSGLYWHMVDLLWVVLFALIYLVP